MDGETWADNEHKEQFHLDLQQPTCTVSAHRHDMHAFSHIHTLQLLQLRNAEFCSHLTNLLLTIYGTSVVRGCRSQFVHQERMTLLQTYTAESDGEHQSAWDITSKSTVSLFKFMLSNTVCNALYKTRLKFKVHRVSYKNVEYICDHNCGNSWEILIIFTYLKTGINALRSPQGSYLLIFILHMM